MLALNWCLPAGALILIVAPRKQNVEEFEGEGAIDPCNQLTDFYKMSIININANITCSIKFMLHYANMYNCTKTEHI